MKRVAPNLLLATLVALGNCRGARPVPSDTATSCWAAIARTPEGCHVDFGETKRRSSSVGVLTDTDDSRADLRCGDSLDLGSCGARLVCDCPKSQIR